MAVVAEMMSADWGRDQVAIAAEAGADVVLLIGPATSANVSAHRRGSRHRKSSKLMILTTLNVDLIPQVMGLMEHGSPYIRVRTESDYWLYASLFSSTCPVALIDGEVAGTIIAFRSQDSPGDVYVQDVMTHPDHRRRGIARALVAHLRDRVKERGCDRIYLTSEPDNIAARAAWESLGFQNVAGDYVTNGVSVTKDFKGPGKDRAVYQLQLR